MLDVTSWYEMLSAKLEPFGDLTVTNYLVIVVA